MSVSFNIPPRRILVRGTNWLGDAVMTTPALLRLREKFPDAYITLLTPEKLVDLWLNHPAIDDVISFTREEGPLSVASRLRAEALKPFMESHRERVEAGRTAYEETAIREGTLAQAAVNVVKQVSQKTIDVAQQGRIDLALVLPNSPRSALEVFLARIPQRIGYARPWRNFFLTQIVPSRSEAVKMHKRTAAEIKNLVAAPPHHASRTTHHASAHQIHEYLHLAATLGANPEPLAPQLFVTPEEIQPVKKKFALEKINGPVFGLNPGAEYGPAKRWPVEKFIAAAKAIQQRTNCTWILFGGKGDLQLSERIESEIQNSKFKIQNFCGQTSLRELMALLKLCRVLLTNDTGPMHVAAALGTPVVVPFGSTSPELTGPGLPGDARNRLIKSDAPCSPCFLRECPIDFRCMNGISVERVVETVLELV
ncbi:MAG TPA: lipopolysaccharide heptosyltransferase II [Candidatus Limnocylindrales bacterium]|nr:lipopolysaccharide heptosyltransferase II [Candidatus Limnocylindrales bacterium]